MNEHKVLKACQEGELERFEELYNTYVKDIYRFVYYRVRNKEVAEDLTGDVFLKALGAISGFRQGSAFRPWLYAIARNTVIDHYRVSKEKATVSLDDDEAPDVPGHHDVERETEAKHTLGQVRDALEKLSEAQREIVVMRVWDELSYKEIAEITGKTEGNCKVIFSRAVAEIRTMVPLSAFILLVIKSTEYGI